MEWDEARRDDEDGFSGTGNRLEMLRAVKCKVPFKIPEDVSKRCANTSFTLAASSLLYINNCGASSKCTRTLG